MVINPTERDYFFSTINQTFKHLGEDVTQNLFKFCEMLVQYNDEYDLSRLKKFKDILEKHFLDSIIISDLINLPESLLDIGTGAGFPGIPLKITQPELQLTLAEPRPLRVKFMRMVIEELKLDSTSVFPHKVNEKMYFPIQGVITRAFESAPATLERCINFLPDGGSVILLKGPGVDEEINDISPIMHEHYRLEKDIPYSLPGTDHKRRLIIYKKTSNYCRRFYQISDIKELTAGTVIESTDNKRYKELKKAAISGPKKSGIALVCGEKIITDNFAYFKNSIVCAVIYDGFSEKNSGVNQIIDQLDKDSKLLLLKKSLYNDLDISGSKKLLLFVECPKNRSLETIDLTRPSLIIPFQDPANTGSVMRSAAAFGITQIVVTAEAANPYNYKSIRTSGGAVFNLDIFDAPSLIETADYFLRNGVKIISLDSSGKPVSDFSFPETFTVIPGIEGPGLPDKLLSHAVSIPMTDKVESLNASTTVSILLYEYFKSIQ